jgi:hypothetical protein
MRVNFEGRYTVDEFAIMMAKVLRMLEEGQFGCLQNIDLRFRAFDLDGRETYPPDEQDRHAGLRFYWGEKDKNAIIMLDWHFPWMPGHEWPEDTN